jgi:hypothetical protein
MLLNWTCFFKKEESVAVGTVAELSDYGRNKRDPMRPTLLFSQSLGINRSTLQTNIGINYDMNWNVF